jgi:phosphohistidine swiveling domain-containing protein
LQKPCIIGTNYASQVLKNGDVIKIDFKQGIIEVIKE